MTQATVSSPTIDVASWQRRLDELAVRHGVPGAQLGILRVGVGDGAGTADEQVVVSTGMLHVPAQIPVRDDALFQIGSISKVWTATVAMQLVDEGRIGLDQPIVEVLEDFRLADMDVARSVTLRHLLTHTSGIDGDVFTDTGRGDDVLAEYVAVLEEQTQNHPIGATWSYCNAGFVVVGRIIEVLTGMTWDAALRERLYAPLGLARTVTLPEEAILHPVAVGHVEDDDGSQRVVPVWTLPRSLGPAGLITATAADVLGFARMHLVGGVAADGTRVLDAGLVDDMAAMQAEVPEQHSLGDSWGLGWIRFGWNGDRLIGHDGNTLGQAAFLRMLPSQGLAVTLLTNGGHSRDLYGDLYREIFAELAGVEMAASLQPDLETPADVDAYLGTYERASVRMEVLPAPSDGEPPILRATTTWKIEDGEPESTDYPLHTVEDGLFATRAPGTETWMGVKLYSLPTGERYLHFGARATPKVA